MAEQAAPIGLAAQWPKMLPGCYEALDALVAKRGGKTLPVSAVYLYLYDVCRSQQQAGMMASELTACWLWQRSGLLRAFSPEQTAGLSARAEDGSLRQLPARQLLALKGITYCRVPQLLEMMDGFFCWINEEMARPPELRIQWLSRDQKHSVAQVLPIRQNASLRDCFWAVFSGADEAAQGPGGQQKKRMERMLWKAIPFVLELVGEPCGGKTAGPDEPAAPKQPFWKRWASKKG